jgi:hypothetical protein
MKKYGLSLLVAIILLSPVGLWACDCDDATPVIHFKDGLTPNGPVSDETGSTNTGHCNCCAESYYFRDYGPAHVAPPVVQSTKRPSS